MLEFFGDFLMCCGPILLVFVVFFVIVFLLIMGAFWISESRIGENLFVMIIYSFLSITILIGSFLFAIYTISIIC